MSARPRSYQRLPQAEVASTPGVSSVDSAHVSASSFEDDGSADDRLEEVSDHDFGDDDDDEHDALKKKKKTRAQRAALWSTKMHALLWVLTAAVVAYAIDFFHVIFNDPRVRRGYFQVGLFCFGINTCITFYLAIYLPYIKHITLEWNVYCPRMIPTATIVGVIASFSFVCAFWPIWGLLTPGLLLLFFIGSLMTAHFLPSI